jgi:eukaryotic-like serine/threonine-protein kinase
MRDQTLMAQRFDDKRLEPVGAPLPVAEQVGSSLNYGYFSASTNGVLVYRSRDKPGRQELVWMDRKGNPVESISPAGDYDNFRLSPDEKSIVFDRGDSTNQDIWVLDLHRGVPTRLTFDSGMDNLPIWSFEGSRVLWPSNRRGTFDLYIKAATGTGQDELQVQMGTVTGWGTDWSRDGKFILYQRPGEKGAQELWIAPQSGDKKPYAYLQSQFANQYGVFSPDGNWVAYVSKESGHDEVYVQHFPRTSEKGGFRATAVLIPPGGRMEPNCSTWLLTANLWPCRSARAQAHSSRAMQNPYF